MPILVGLEHTALLWSVLVTASTWLLLLLLLPLLLLLLLLLLFVINDSCSSRLEESVQSFFREADEQFGWSPGPDRKRPLVKVGFHVRLTDASDHLERFNNASRFTGAQLLGMMEEVLQVIKLDARGACGMRTCSC